MTQSPKKSARIFSVILGFVGVLAVLCLYLLGWDRRAELHALDLRLRHGSRLAPSPDIVLVAVDDSSLEELGRWPWPRERLAAIVETLTECGARAVGLDIIFPEPQKVRYVAPADTVYGGADSSVIEQAPPVPVFDDALLADAVRRGRDVFLPAHIDFSEARPGDLEARVEEVLVRQPALTAPEVAERLRLPLEEVGKVLSQARENAINHRVRGILLQKPQVGLSTLLGELLPGLPSGKVSQERQIAERAYLRVRALEALIFSSVPESGATAFPVRSGALVPPLVTFARAARGSGFVTFEPDEDGVVRRIPLLARADTGLYPQFALAMAAHELAGGLGRCNIDAGPPALTIRCADGSRKAIPVDRGGSMLIHWARAPRAGDNAPRRDIRAAAVFAVWEEKRKLKQLEDLAYGLRVAFLKIGATLPGKAIEALYWEFMEQTGRLDEAYKKRLQAEYQEQRDSLYGPPRAPGSSLLDRLRREESDVEQKLHGLAGRLVDELRKPANLEVFLGKPERVAASSQPNSDKRKERKEYEQAMASFRKAEAAARQTLDLLDSLPLESRKLQASAKKLMDELRPLVAGKICLVGSTATGAADFVPTPLGRRVPGVVVHANVMNTILSGSFLREASFPVSLAVILAAGILVSLLAATRPVVQAGALTAVLGVGYAAFNTFVVFALWNVWLIVVAPLGAMLASYLVVTAYRELTEERAKRHIRDMFAHALSPVLVDQLLEDPSLAELGGQKRVLSCMFSDLAGFTALSERLGPQDTVRLLNRYFDGATEVIQTRWGGYLNKYLGDGIFAFFGAPVVLDDHPTRAAQAAVDCQLEAARLNEALEADLGAGARLTVRVGIASGEAMVGNCGSSQRMDYTAIGECVNLASRLESVCKYFGVGVLLDDQAWTMCDQNLFIARSLGKVGIVGVREPVKIWQVIGRAETAREGLKDAAGSFGRAMDLLAERKFSDAMALLERVLTAMPDDKPARIYLDLCRECIGNWPAADWPGKTVNEEDVTLIACR